MLNNIFDYDISEFISPKNAAVWASEYIGKQVTINNIIYLINYGKIANHSTNSKEKLINKNELKAYYDTHIKSKIEFNHPLSFSKYKESQTTKHIHRIHPYKGKFIPQLVEYFLDSHIDELKKKAFFKKGDIVLDPFCGSGTTLSVANELGINAIGIDISIFNSILSNVKITNYNLRALDYEIKRITNILQDFVEYSNILDFENALNLALREFNQKNFPNKNFKRQIALKQINEKSYGKLKENEFLPIFTKLLNDYHIQTETNPQGGFFEKWYLPNIKKEIMLLKNEITKSPKDLQDILYIILSRTARSCRATTHSDLATLIEPITTSYYCSKHGRICKPLFSIFKWWKSYAFDTIKRLKEFSYLRTETKQICLNADSTNCNILSELELFDKDFSILLNAKKIAGIFSSPPYVGLIDYHEQHAYAYDILGLKRKDEKEIGRLSEGQTKIAKEKYMQNIAKVLLNAKKFLVKDYNVFLVANDKFNLYPKIAELANMRIVARFERPVINRSEKGKNKYSESIFFLKEKY